MVIAFAVVDLATVDFVVANFDYFEKFVDFDETEFVVFAEIAVVVAVLEDFECFVAVEFVEVVAFVEVAVP